MIEILKDEQYRNSLLERIRDAKKEILIITYKCDFKATLGSRHLNAIVMELKRAQARDVKVWILLNYEGPTTSIGRTNAEAAKKLEGEGLLVKLTHANRTYHAKIIIVDKGIAFIGSHNLSESSLCRNFEISLMITGEWPAVPGVWDGKQTIQDLREIFLKEWYR